MLSLDQIEEQLRAIAQECESVRRGNTPGYMTHRALEHIEGRVADLRRALEPSFLDLHAVYRVADLVAARMARALAAETAETARSTLLAVETERAASARVVALVADWRAARAPLAALADALPAWASSGSARLVSLHLRACGVPAVDADAAGAAIVAHYAPADLPDDLLDEPPA